MILCWLFLFNSFTLIDYVIKNKEVSLFFDEQTTIFYTISILIIHFLYFYSKGRDASIYEPAGARLSATETRA
jgi:hypothetical protein